MSQDIRTIDVWSGTFLLKGAGGVNCYLIKTDNGHILIDTGLQSKRTEFVQELEKVGG